MRAELLGFLLISACGARSELSVDAALPLTTDARDATLDATDARDATLDAADARDATLDAMPPVTRLVPLFPTGVDAERNALMRSVLDPHWQVSLSAEGPFVAALTTAEPGTRRTPLRSNAIVHPSGTPINANAFYRTQIVLPEGVSPARTELELDVGYDNYIVDSTTPRSDYDSPDYPYLGNFFMRINGVWSRFHTGCDDTPFVGRANYQTECHVRIVDGNFRLGVNLIEIWVLNFGGPYGLRIESVVTRTSPP